jgi:hypothetical protein
MGIVLVRRWAFLNILEVGLGGLLWISRIEVFCGFLSWKCDGGWN